MTQAFSRRKLLAGATLGAAVLAAPAVLAQAPQRVRFGSFFTPNNPLWVHILGPYFEEVAQASGGAVEFEFATAGVNLRGADVPDTLRSGVIDVALQVASYNPGRFNALGVVEMPLIAADARTGSMGAAAVAEAGLLDGFNEMHLIGASTADAMLMHHRGAVSGLDGFRGAKLRSAGPVIAQVIEALGGAAVGLPAPQIPEALARGVVDGAVADWFSVQGFGLGEVTRSHLEVFLGSAGIWVAMNPRAYQRLPEAARAALDGLSGPTFAQFWGERLQRLSDGVRATIAASPDHTILTPTEAERQELEAIAATVHANWIEATPNGQAIFDAFRAGVAAAAA